MEQRTQTSTQIRNFYCDQSCLGMKFYNVNLALQFYRSNGKNQNGRNSYDTKNGEITTVNFEGAYALWKACQDIIDEKVQTLNLVIPAGSGATLTLDRKMINNVYETTLSIQKNGKTIEFKFNTIQQQVNGQFKQIESGLGAFQKTIDGYLVEINGSRHLNKLTEMYIKSQEQNKKTETQFNDSYKGNNYGNNNYQKRYSEQNNQSPNTQSFSDYRLNN